MEETNKGNLEQRGPRIEENVAAVLTNIETGEKRVIRTHNIITIQGDVMYSRAAGKGINGVEIVPTIAGMRLGYNTSTPGTPGKSHTDMSMASTPSTPFATRVVDSGYPKVNDDDTNNPGRGSTTLSWRCSFGASEAVHVDIATLDLPNIFTAPSYSLCIANFAAKFEKTAVNTLQVYVNHTFLGA